MQYHPSNEYVLASGSYDGSARVWDCRNLSKPTGSLDTGGGVWRTKWYINKEKGEEEEEEEYLVLSCMHAGSHVLRVDKEGSTLRSITQHPPAKELGEKHLAYGIAMLDHDGERVDNKGKRLLASASFYENSVHLWGAQL